MKTKLFVLATLISSCVSAAAADRLIEFNRDIRPLLADRCFHCHGPDSATREAGLRLDQEDAAKSERDGTQAIAPGDPDRSELIARIFSHDPDVVMPPSDSGRQLSDEEKTKLRTWIEEGASWQQHWAFIPPEKPQLPVVADLSWPRNEIDSFVLRRLEDAEFAPSPDADRAKWLRRVSFDLIGLPPTLEELDDFLNDDSPDAFERVVDRLLASSRYGEHMAADWLDAARYADTDGYQNDGPRTMFRYRDWVIDAFNQNMPFDQFTIEQLAGDLIPNASLSQKIATGFNRNHRYNSEAGLVLEEFLLENAVDRVDTTSTVWMGLTMGCARCHDHKYDPFSQREYYQLISFFDNITESGRAIKFGNSEPWITAPTTSQQSALAKLDDEIRQAEQQFSAELERLTEDAAQLTAKLRETTDSDSNLDDFTAVSDGLVKRWQFEEMKSEGITIEQGRPVLREGFCGKSATVGGKGILALGQFGDVSCQTRSTISFWLKPEQLSSGVILSRQAKNTRRPGFSVELRDGHLQFYIITRWVAGVGMVETTERLTAGEWVHVCLTNDGSQRATGQQIWIDGKLAETRTVYNTNSNTGGTAKTAVLRIGGGVYGDLFKGQLDDLRFYNRTLFADEIDLLAEPKSVHAIVSGEPAEVTKRMTTKLALSLLEPDKALQGSSDFDLNMLREVRSRFQQLRVKRVRLLDSFPTSMVMEERPKPKQTHVRVRGVYDSFGDAVESDVPRVFPPIRSTKQRSRTEFAKWLVDGKHPLTARVMVNRMWQHYFGIGLVDTPEDFGTQGSLPSHPRLLDWMAVRFVESGWDVKAMHRLIVLSATYRQSSRRRLDVDGGDSAPDQTDPDNRLLWRGPRVRLSARQLRDQALYVSGLLNPDIGGPSVSPYQPPKLWDEMSNMKYRQSKGKDLYRRGLYTIWKRTIAPPSLAILDAADRESCVVRPKRTNTPLQALALMNETTFVESARHLATRMQNEGGDAPIVWLFRNLTSRIPTDAERLKLSTARATFQRQFEAAPEAAEQLLSVGDSKVPPKVDQVALAADTMFCNTVLNLDETLTKE